MMPDDQIWESTLVAAESAGLELSEINSFDKEQLTFKGARGTKGLERATNKDIVLNLQKPRPTDARSGDSRIGSAEPEKRVAEAIAAYLANTSPPAKERTLQAIWNRALDSMLRDGSVQISMAAVGEMLPHYFKAVDGAWHLRGEAVIGGNAFDLKSDTGALAWLTQVLGNELQTMGELIPRWQAETAHTGADAGRLERLLQENFWLEKRTGRWRLPTAEEREKMSAHQSIAEEAHLRTVRRYLDGKLDESMNDGKRFEWARFCYNQQAYAEALALAQPIDPSHLDSEQARDLRRLIAVCRQKAGAP